MKKGFCWLAVPSSAFLWASSGEAVQVPQSGNFVATNVGFQGAPLENSWHESDRLGLQGSLLRSTFVATKGDRALPETVGTNVSLNNSILNLEICQDETDCIDSVNALLEGAIRGDRAVADLSNSVTTNSATITSSAIEHNLALSGARIDPIATEIQTDRPLSPNILTDFSDSQPNFSTGIELNGDSTMQIGQTGSGEAGAIAEILAPGPGETTDLPATTVIARFPSEAEVTLLVNGEAVSPDLVGRTETDTATGITVQTWYGVPLQEGENTIALSVNGQTVESFTVGVSGTPTQVQIATRETRVPADGRSSLTVTGQVLDANNQLVQRDTVVTLSASAGEFIGADYNLDAPGFQVQAVGGEFSAQLQAPLDAQIVRIRGAIDDASAEGETLEAFTRAEFTTYLRPSLVTGLVNFRLGKRGTNYWGSFRDFLPADEDYDYEADLSGAVFATGKLGGWLFTGAYNSDRSLNCDCNGNDRRLFRDTQATELDYPLYGDNSTASTVAPSRDSVYLRFERSSPVENAGLDYFMWGDYNTEELANRTQEFTALTRSFHGFKANYNFGGLQLTGLYANDVEGFQRDAIAPDGTSGYYFFSRRLLIDGSENIFIELEELGRPGNIIARQQLNRGEDYEIDYDRGTILFRRPLQRTDVVTDATGVSIVVVRRIVATYQYEERDGDTNLWGGRMRYHFSRDYNNPIWIGATYLRQNQGIRDFELYGADLMFTFGNATESDRVTSGATALPSISNAEFPETLPAEPPTQTSTATPFSGELFAEYAHSTNDSELLGLVTGEAYRIELNARGGPLTGRAYYRTTDSGFANDATTSFVPGQTRYGTQLSSRLTSTTRLNFNFDREENSGVAPRPITQFDDFLTPRLEAIPGSEVDNSLTTISAGLQQQIYKATLGVDWVYRHRTDDRPTSPLDVTSSQLRSRLLVPITSKISFRAQNELSLSSDEDIVYPDRTILGLDWRLLPGVTAQLNQVWFTSGQYEDNSITSFNLNGDYNLTDDTTLTGRYSFVDGRTMGAALGIQHGWTIVPGLRLNLAYEHVFGSLFSRNATGTEFAQPYAPGQSSAALGIRSGDSYSIGLEYTDNPDFTASARYEHRFSSSGDNTVIQAAATGKLTDAISVLGRYHQASSSNQLLEDIGDTINLRFGFAFRDPQSDKFNALLRYDFRQNPSSIPDTILFGSGTKSQDHTLALESIFAPNWRWEFYGKYAWRRSTSYLADDLVGTNTVSLAQLRATYRLGYRWDVVGEGRWIYQPSANFSEFGVVAEVGFYLTPDLRLAAGYVFGKVDADEMESDRSASGPYLNVSMKLNQLWPGFGQQPVAPPQQQESAVELSLQPVHEFGGER
jgi:hypothetical protein